MLASRLSVSASVEDGWWLSGRTTSEWPIDPFYNEGGGSLDEGERD